MNNDLPPSLALMTDAFFVKRYDLRGMFNLPFCPLCGLPAFIWAGICVHEVETQEWADSGLVVIIKKGCDFEQPTH